MADALATEPRRTDPEPTETAADTADAVVVAVSVDPTGWDDAPVEQLTAAPGEKRLTRRG